MSSPEQPFYTQTVCVIDGNCNFWMGTDDDGDLIIQIKNEDGLMVHEVRIKSDGMEELDETFLTNRTKPN